MILLDENIPESQRQLLRSWRIRVRQIGVDISEKGVQDDAIIPLLHEIGRTTFFTRDLGFFHRKLAHSAYCLVCLDTQPSEVASYVRRLLRHPRFSTQRQRLGSVVRVGHRGITRLALRGPDEIIGWSQAAPQR